MKDTLTAENSADFRQRYRGTFGYYETSKGNKLLVKLIEVDTHEVRFRDERGGEFSARADSGIGFEFFSVERKVFNTPAGVMYVRRLPARQWARGVGDSNTLVTNLSDGGRKVVLSFNTLDMLFNPKLSHQAYVNKLLNGEAKSAALNNRFCIVGESVFMFDLKIGEYKDKVMTIDPLYLQEVSDVVKRNNYSIEVK